MIGIFVFSMIFLRSINQLRLRMKIIFIVALCLVGVLSKKLVFVEQIFRHGARYPIYEVSGDTSASAQNIRGELTTQGKHMQYILGRIMYDEYWKPLFAGTDYLNKYSPSVIYVKSTNVNRTIESAESQLLGLLEDLPPYELPINQLNNSLPPFANASDYEQTSQNQTTFNVFGSVNTNFHTIPIHMEKEISSTIGSGYKYRANPYDEGEFLSKYDPAQCPNQHFWGKENLLSEAAMHIKSADRVSAFLSALGDQVGTAIKYEEAYKYIDDFECERNMGNNYFRIFNDDRMFRTAEFIFLTSTVLKYFYTQDQIRTSSTGLLQATVRNMKQAMEGKGPRLVLYSAHDTTILAFAAALNFLNLDCIMASFFDQVSNEDTCISKYPSFASNFVLELWQQDDLSYTIRILYNGVPRQIPICGYKQECPFAEFQAWASGFYLQNPNLTCGIREQYTKLYIVIGVLSVFVVVFIVATMHARFKKRIQEKMLEMEEKKGYIQNFEEKEGGTIH